VVLQDWNSEPTHSWSTYVRPPRWLSRDLGPHHVHGISRRHLVFASTPAKAMKKFADLTNSRSPTKHRPSLARSRMHAQVVPQTRSSAATDAQIGNTVREIRYRSHTCPRCPARCHGNSATSASSTPRQWRE
jgi:hypothetical protein